MTLEKLDMIGDGTMSLDRMRMIGGESLADERMTAEKIMTIGYCRLSTEELEEIGPEELVSMSLVEFNALYAKILKQKEGQLINVNDSDASTEGNLKGEKLLTNPAAIIEPSKKNIAKIVRNLGGNGSDDVKNNDLVPENNSIQKALEIILHASNPRRKNPAMIGDFNGINYKNSREMLQAAQEYLSEEYGKEVSREAGFSLGETVFYEGDLVVIVNASHKDGELGEGTNRIVVKYKDGSSKKVAPWSLSKMNNETIMLARKIEENGKDKYGKPINDVRTYVRNAVETLGLDNLLINDVDSAMYAWRLSGNDENIQIAMRVLGLKRANLSILARAMADAKIEVVRKIENDPEYILPDML